MRFRLSWIDNAYRVSMPRLLVEKESMEVVDAESFDVLITTLKEEILQLEAWAGRPAAYGISSPSVLAMRERAGELARFVIAMEDLHPPVERRTHKRVSDWTDKLRQDQRIT